MKRLLSACWGWCLGGTGPILARAVLSVRPFRDEVDSEDEREETLHYFKTAVSRSQDEATLRENLQKDEEAGTSQDTDG